MDERPPRVFISYTHDSREHKKRVLALSDRLRDDGVDCTTDQYETSPPEGWPRWMQRQVRESDFVLVVCTETYDRRFRGDEVRGRGKGADWEGAAIIQALYDGQGRNTKFIPVALSPPDVAHVPAPLAGATYVLDSDDGYHDLYRRLTGQPWVERPPLGTRKPLPRRARKGEGNPASAAGAFAPDPPPRSAGRTARPGRRRAGADTTIVIVRRDGQFILSDYERVTSEETLTVHVRAPDPHVSAFMRSLRAAGREEVALAFGLRAARGHVESMRETHEGGREVWQLSVREADIAGGGFGFEFSTPTYSADEIAGLKARHLLLDEPMPRQSEMFGIGFGHGPAAFVKPVPLWQELRRRFGDDHGRLATAARLLYTLQLTLLGVVGDVHRLHLAVNGNSVRVDFEGRRPRAFSNVEPPLIRVGSEYRFR